MSYVKKTTEQLKNLVTMIHKRFPDNKDISLGLTAVETLCNHNRQKLFEIFLTHVYFKKTPTGVLFRDLIKNRDIDFFLNKDSTHVIKLQQKSETVINVISGIRENWKDLEESEKESIWIYFDVFIKLTDKYFQNKRHIKLIK